MTQEHHVSTASVRNEHTGLPCYQMNDKTVLCH